MLVPDPERPGERRVKVLDFGIAKLSQQASGSDGKVRTETGTMIGTPAYMAPEQCLADPNLDGKADVYALGIMLYEMLAARLPFTAQHSFDFMAAHVRGYPRPLSEVVPQAPLEVADLVHAMLAKTPAERPSMDAVVALIDQLQAALPVIWSMPRLSGPYPQVGSESLALGVTAQGQAFPSPRPSKELVELGATVPGTPTPPGLHNKDLLAQTPRPGPSFPASANSPLARKTPLPGAGDKFPASISQVTPRAFSSAAVPAASDAAPEPSAPPPSGATRWLGGLLVLVLACVVTYLGVLRRVPYTPIPVAAPVVNAPPRVIKWVVQSVPSGAEVLRADGQIMGSTPWEFSRSADAGETTIRLHHPGFHDKTMVLNHGTDIKMELHLEPLPQAPVPSPVVVLPAENKPRAKRHKLPSVTPKSTGNDVQLLLD